MRQIKFRGKKPDGELVIGSYAYVLMSPMILDDYGHYHDVDPETIAQLIGYDKDGNEVYEGDDIRSHFGNICKATFRHYAGIIDGDYKLARCDYEGD